MVDKNLFLHDLAVVAILKNEGHYLKEWLDYHLMAGVNHFYLYDNESTDNQAEVAKPYVEAGLVDYISLPDKAAQMRAYIDATNKFKFHCRYMAFIDGDEFIYPKINSGGGVINVIDETLARNPNASGLEISQQIFGSNGQEKADYTRGVLERFTRRGLNNHNSEPLCKTISNPRRIRLHYSPYLPDYFFEIYTIRSNGEKQRTPSRIIPPLTDKIVINHYLCKSREEYSIKSKRGDVYVLNRRKYTKEFFDKYNLNDEFDDGILKYRNARAEVYQPPDKPHPEERLLKALEKNLSLTLLPDTPQDFYADKMETFLTCRAVSSYLKIKLADKTKAKFFEEKSLAAILKSLDKMNPIDAMMLIRELPNLLNLPYPAAQGLRGEFTKRIPQIKENFYLNRAWRYYVDLDYIADLLKAW